MMLELSRKRRPWWMTNFGRESMGDVFFDRLYPEWVRDFGEDVSPRVDFSERDGKYYLTAELPGLNKEDISVVLENGYVTLSGRKEGGQEEKGSDYYLKETRYGSFCRSFKMPRKVLKDKVDATYKDGVLTVVIPHEEGAETKKIEIH